MLKQYFKAMTDFVGNKNIDRVFLQSGDPALTDNYGEWILYVPEFNKNTYFLWLFPLAIFIFGGILIFKKKT